VLDRLVAAVEVEQLLATEHPPVVGCEQG
jgi:hypothetical protein